jgi:hypothetical protein
MDGSLNLVSGVSGLAYQFLQPENKAAKIIAQQKTHGGQRIDPRSDGRLVFGKSRAISGDTYFIVEMK